ENNYYLPNVIVLFTLSGFTIGPQFLTCFYQIPTDKHTQYFKIDYRDFSPTTKYPHSTMIINIFPNKKIKRNTLFCIFVNQPDSYLSFDVRSQLNCRVEIFAFVQRVSKIVKLKK
ncbi:hypothetical protein BpHYR1_041190, partial [Brachionus plicatilis]